jgi:excisionase family DNA binding protein
MNKNQIIFDFQSKDELKDLIERSLTEVIKNNTLNRPKEQELLTREQTAKRFNVDLSTLHRWTRQGKIVAHAIGSRIYYKESSIQGALIKIKKST